MDQGTAGIGLFAEDTICTELRAGTKDEAIEEMVGMLYDAGVVTDKAVFTQVIYDREALSSTGMGMGFAIPHGRSDVVTGPRVAFGLSRNGLDFKAPDGTLANMVFMIAISPEENNLHLKILAALSRKLMHKEFREGLMACKSKAEVLEKLSAVTVG